MAVQRYENSHNLRKYIVLVTLIVGIIFVFILFLKEDNDSNELTGLVVGDSFSENDKKNVPTNHNLVSPLALSFSIAPEISKDGKIEDISIGFNDITNSITVNGNNLEFSDSSERTLLLKSFDGNFDLRENGLTLKGKAKRLEVNGLFFSAERGIEVEFSNLHYQSISLPEVTFDSITFDNGAGILSVGDRFTYNLQEEKVSLNKFSGKVTLGSSVDSFFSAEGNADSVSVSGGSLELVLN